MSEQKTLSPLEKDALQEIMNIAFGMAAADLSEVIRLYVTLTVPHIDVLPLKEVFRFIQNGLPPQEKGLSMITQSFTGEFSGTCILIFPHGEGQKLLQLFGEQSGFASAEYDMDVLERETLIEISNIIIGACISKIAELLGDTVGYAPPRFYNNEQILNSLAQLFWGENVFAVFFKTVFHFEDFDASGSLFLVCDQKQIEWLQKGIERYLSQYA